MGTVDTKEEIKQNISDEEEKRIKYKKLKMRCEEIQKKKKDKFPICIGLLTALTFSILFAIIIFDTYNQEISPWGIILSLGCGIMAGCCMVIYVILMLDMKENQIRREMLEFETEDTQNEVKEDIFENSIKMSYKYLDQYYLQTREQAQRGFFVTVMVAVFGAVLIAFGIIAMFFGKTSPAYITCAAGVITEFVSAVFFYLYNRTISSMSKYHNKLVLSQNISIALKVSDTLPSDDKVKAKNHIITELLKDINSYLIKNDSEEFKGGNSNSKS